MLCSTTVANVSANVSIGGTPINSSSCLEIVPKCDCAADPEKCSISYCGDEIFCIDSKTCFVNSYSTSCRTHLLERTALHGEWGTYSDVWILLAGVVPGACVLFLCFVAWRMKLRPFSSKIVLCFILLAQFCVAGWGGVRLWEAFDVVDGTLCALSDINAQCGSAGCLEGESMNSVANSLGALVAWRPSAIGGYSVAASLIFLEVALRLRWFWSAVFLGALSIAVGCSAYIAADIVCTASAQDMFAVEGMQGCELCVSTLNVQVLSPLCSDASPLATSVWIACFGLFSILVASWTGIRRRGKCAIATENFTTSTAAAATVCASSSRVPVCDTRAKVAAIDPLFRSSFENI